MWFALFDAELTRDELMNNPKTFKIGLYSNIILNHIFRFVFWKILILEVDLLRAILSYFSLFYHMFFS